MKKTILMLGSVLLTGSLFAQQWQKIDDLESFTVGDEVDADHSTTATGDWNMYRSADDQYATLPFFGVAADPGDGSQGNVLELNPGTPTEAGQGNTTLERAVPTAAQIVDPFPETTKSTFYMKYFRPIVDGSPAESDTTWGMVAESARNTETGIHAYGSYSVLGRTEIDGIIDIRDGGDYLDLTTAALETETWYEFWFVVDHANNEFTQYIKGGTDFPTQTQLPMGAPITAEYRNQTLDPLSTILLITTTGGADNRKGKDSIYVDDFYIDVTGENLSSPVDSTWQMIDNLESFTVGDEVDADHSTTATGDWNMYRSADDQYATLPFFGVAADPGDGSQGNVLELNPGTPTEAGQGNTTLERAVPTAAQIVDPFPETTKSTFYMKYFRPIVDGSPAESDTTWGMVAESARNTETGIHAYGSYSVLGRTEIDGIIDIRDGGDYLDLTTAALETETWYEFWFVVDHANNEFTQYIKGGTDFPTQTQLPMGAPITAEYRNQTLDPLSTILLITTTGGADNRKGKDSIYVDDFFIDVTGENLSTPGTSSPPVDTTPKAVGEDAGSTTITLAAGSVFDGEVGDTVFDGETALGIIASIDGSVITLEDPLAAALAADTVLSARFVEVQNDNGINVKFVNIATRGLVGANAGEELIAGFVLLGDNPQEVLIRGLGPDLTDRGVAGALTDPTFEVRNFAGAVVASNDDWGNATDNADVAAAIAEASSDPAAGLADGSSDAAILVTLPQNDVYTVVVSSAVAGESGVALVEVFEMDQ